MMERMETMPSSSEGCGLSFALPRAIPSAIPYFCFAAAFRAWAHHTVCTKKRSQLHTVKSVPMDFVAELGFAVAAAGVKVGNPSGHSRYLAPAMVTTESQCRITHYPRRGSRVILNERLGTGLV